MLYNVPKLDVLFGCFIWFHELRVARCVRHDGREFRTTSMASYPTARHFDMDDLKLKAASLNCIEV